MFQISGLQGNTDYRFRVGACRRCQDTCQELCGPLSPSSLFTLRRQETAASSEMCAMETGKGAGLISSDERFAALIVCVFAGFSILIACLLQYFFMKWGNFNYRIERERKITETLKKKKRLWKNRMKSKHLIYFYGYVCVVFFCFFVLFFFSQRIDSGFLTLFLLSSAFTGFGIISFYVFVSPSVSVFKDFCRGKPFLSCTSVGKENW